jgi:phosphate transport system ATP-binding protein
MAEPTAIRVRRLSVAYGHTSALADVSLDIPARQITAIIGPSGCGKTTLLRSLNRLIDGADELCMSGEIWVDGENILDRTADVSQVRRKLGLLSQQPYPLPMSIYDNVAYGPRLHGTRDLRRLDEIVRRYLEMAGLWDEVKDRLRRPASALSIGQQQRLCLARGLAVSPQVILADEPTSALDPASSRLVEQLFHQLKQDYTIIVVTHILRQARRLADYLVFLYLGQLIEHGPAQQMFEHPEHEMTREYMKGVFS